MKRLSKLEELILKMQLHLLLGNNFQDMLIKSKWQLSESKQSSLKFLNLPKVELQLGQVSILILDSLRLLLKRWANKLDILLQLLLINFRVLLPRMLWLSSMEPLILLQLVWWKLQMISDFWVVGPEVVSENLFYLRISLGQVLCLEKSIQPSVKLLLC